MDATKQCAGVLATFLLVLQFGCNKDSPQVAAPTLNGQNCQGQVKAKSFLVSWKTLVPHEFQNNVIYSGSKITKFQNVDKSWVENHVLKPHRNEYLIAEYEFFAERIRKVKIESNCNSLSLPNTWGPADIQATEAWNYLGKKGDGVIVAVIDSGVDINHPLLKNQIWTNSMEAMGLMGIDDDGDGYVDDIHGWNFADNSSDVFDDSNHGTHVAGIIGGSAGANNFTGVAPNVQILPLKFINAQGDGSVSDAIKSMKFALSHGAKVINASWGGGDCSSVLKQEILDATLSGTVFANASGNDGNDLNRLPEWPAAFQVPGKITVGAYNVQQYLSIWSNYGILVDVAAPGEKILSTIPPDPGQPEGQLCDKSGTSMATPFVAGVAALLLSAKPTLSPTAVADAINSSVVNGSYGVRTHGKLNALNAAQWAMAH